MREGVSTISPQMILRPQGGLRPVRRRTRCPPDRAMHGPKQGRSCHPCRERPPSSESFVTDVRQARRGAQEVPGKRDTSQVYRDNSPNSWTIHCLVRASSAMCRIWAGGELSDVNGLNWPLRRTNTISSTPEALKITRPPRRPGFRHFPS